MGRPMIGITWGRNVVKRSAGLGENLLRYQDLLVRAELTPVVITPGTATDVLSRLEGLMIPGGPDIAFELPGADRMRLLEGLDDIGHTLKHAPEIAAFEERMAGTQPWLQIAADSRR